MTIKIEMQTMIKIGCYVDVIHYQDEGRDKSFKKKKTNSVKGMCKSILNKIKKEL